MNQEERLARYQKFKNFQSRILCATNLFGRGMDIERVNIVFNYDMPEDSDTYLHRVARAGRFGTKVTHKGTHVYYIMMGFRVWQFHSLQTMKIQRLWSLSKNDSK